MTSENKKTLDTVTKAMVNNHVKHLYNFLKEKEIVIYYVNKQRKTNKLGRIIDSLGGTYLVNPIDEADNKEENENSYGGPSLPKRHRKWPHNGAPCDQNQKTEWKQVPISCVCIYIYIYI